MTRKSIAKLSQNDEIILASYSSMLDALSEYFGSSYEFVLHRLDNLDKSVIKIVNGHYTGRDVGAPITDLALNMLAKINDSSAKKDYICYQGTTKNDEPLHSSTILIRGEYKNPIALICINFYLNTPMYKFFSEIFNRHNENESIIMTENFATDVDETIREAIYKAKSQVEHSKESISASQKNKSIIELLYNDGIFKLKGAVPAVSRTLGIAKNTVYMHLKKFE
ncbi:MULTISPECIES: helix-turn-helix transcriptional regulator [Photorhabdus]|uniref:PAS domain-containing protein n=3 Tax=Photorhabdus TaxID=29487 RepID=A0AAW6BQE6_9GAMM|nr:MULTISPECIES: PAS domain-containing protein [Photorhabdus]EYU13901.1 hypothetical protein BA1DRAFT_03586 [Photorhabdus aegyptia]MDB6375056.1 PAS domain-containing protein [Photorhabdus bodei]TDB43243.1 hypothetical protein C5468_24100 [Photorhabdus luminescens subsp. mexicana]